VSTIILGLGNPVLRDDSIGFNVARALKGKVVQPDVDVVTASVAGLDILDLLSGYEQAIIVDAIQTGEAEAGKIYRLEPETLKTSRQTTPHDIDFITALELGNKLGLDLPRKVTIFAVEAGDTSPPSEKCTPQVEAAIPLCVDMITDELSRSQEKYYGS
jgi:hydrogenase maturation protease